LPTVGAERCAGFFDVIDPLKDLVSVQQLSAPQAWQWKSLLNWEVILLW
jgi:hypothetical protein